MTTSVRRGRWLLPASLGVQGTLILAAKWIGGAPLEGAVWLAAALGLAASVAAAGHGDVVKTLRGDEIDERLALIDLRAIGITASALLVTLFALFLYESAAGHSGTPYGPLLALSSVTYVVALSVINRRS